MKFLLPEGLDRTYYVTEKFLEVNYISQLVVVVNLLTTFILQTEEEGSSTADMIQQVGDMRSLLERSLNKLSRIQDQLKIMELTGTLDESGYVDFYQQDNEESACSMMRGQFNFEKENSRNHSLLPLRNRKD